MISAISKVLSQSQQHRLVSLSCNVTRNVSFPEGGVKYSIVYSSVGRFGPSSPSEVHPNSDTAFSRLQMVLPGKQPHIPIPISKCLPNTEGLKPKTSSTAAQRFCSVEEASFPHRITRIHGNFSRVQGRWGDDMALPSEDTGRCRTTWVEPSWSFFALNWSSIELVFVFGFPFHASGVFSLVSCSRSFISSWGGLARSKNPH